uniref:DUF243 domain-containing protein n=1 Tax=Megaselia scalaris TaxID=36166 RepID=T1GCG0_MEGSC
MIIQQCHVYFLFSNRKPIIPSPPQKHYKIVFIKAPQPPTTPLPSIPPPQVNEEKTIIYVLVRKLEETPDLVIPTPASTSPSKPEVYFIRYKTEKEQGGGDGQGYEKMKCARAGLRGNEAD